MGDLVEGLRRRLFYRLRTKIALPFALLTLLVAGVGAYMVVRFVGVSFEDRLTGYVVDAVDVTSQSIVRLENEQLEALGVVADAEDVPQATASRDAVELANLLVPLKMKYKLDVIEVVDVNGREILGIKHDPGSDKMEDFSLSQEVELSSLPIVGRLIAPDDQMGESQVEILPDDAGQVLWMGAPIRDDGETVGCILTGVYLKNLTEELTELAVARVSLYDGGGRGMASTFFQAPEEESIGIEIRDNLQADPDSVFFEHLKWEGREYLVGYTPLVIHGNELGTIAAAVNTEHIAESNVRASAGMIGLFSAAGLGVLVVGYFIAGRVTTPLGSLAETSEKIAAGDFASRVQRESSDDEIGQLARTFNFMAGELETHTEQLSRRIAELRVLYESGSELNKTLDLAEILEVAVDTLGRSEEICLVLLLDREEGGEWRWAAARGLAATQHDNLLYSRLEVLPVELALAAQGDKPLVISDIEEVETLRAEMGFDAEVTSLMAIPLASSEQLIGIALLGTRERSGFSDHAQLNLLQAISTQIARAIQNARLYGQVKENMIRQDALLRVSRSIGAKLSQDEVVEHVLSGIVEVSKADTVVVSVWDTASKRLQLAGANREVRDDGNGKWLGSEMARRAVQDACSLTMRDGDIVLASSGNGSSALGNRLCVPMVVEDQVVGAIFVEASNGCNRFLSDDLMALTTVSNQAAVAMKNTFLYEDIRNLYRNVVRSLAATIDAYDQYTYGHSHRVTTNSLVVADSLGLDSEERNALEIGAYLHDIGKIGIPDSILLKASSLSEDQIQSVEEHPVVGARILEPVGFDEEVISIVLSHHERVDGRGYPLGLKDGAIPLGARILCVADSFDAMVSNRPYRSKLPVKAALRELRDGAGTQFDSAIVKEFTAACRAGRIVLPGNVTSHQPAEAEAGLVLRQLQ